MGKASTGTRAPHNARADLLGAFADGMSRFFILVFALFLALVIAGFFVIGAFPPHVHRQPVEHVLPNDRFK